MRFEKYTVLFIKKIYDLLDQEIWISDLRLFFFLIPER